MTRTNRADRPRRPDDDTARPRRSGGRAARRRRRARPGRRSDHPRRSTWNRAGKPKPGVSGKVGGPGRDQPDLVDRDRRAQVDLDPGGGVGLGMDRRVVAVGRAVSAADAGRGDPVNCRRSALIWSSSSATAGLVECVDLLGQRPVAIDDGLAALLRGRSRARPARGLWYGRSPRSTPAKTAWRR